MKTVVFSINDGSIKILSDGNIAIYDLSKDIKEMIVATTIPNESAFGKKLYLLPQSLIRTPKTDEELANEDAKDVPVGIGMYTHPAFIRGRKSVGGEFHLTRKEFELALIEAIMSDVDTYDIMKNLYDKHNSSIYPHTITVEHDGNNYLWETLEAEY